MERGHKSKPESREVPSMIAQIANQATKLIQDKRFDRLPDAVGSILDRQSLSDRPSVFRSVMSELGRRGARMRKKYADERKKNEEEQMREYEEFLREETIRDAYAHQMRQPPSTWDLDHPENSP